MTTNDLYLGLISGTSMDGIDVALTAFEDDRPRLLAAHCQPYPAAVRQEILALCQEGSVHALGELDVVLGQHFAKAALALLAKAEVAPEKIRAIGSHGQTVRHSPAGVHPFTLQIADPNTIAERTGITTVADFRRRDMAAGGEGAPLVPAFHQAVFSTNRSRVILNIGGIANITRLSTDHPVVGFDTGPGNTLMDAWIRQHQGQSYDKAGQWAAGGRVVESLLGTLRADPYFSRLPPKSTGPEHFNLGWMDAALAAHPGVSAQDIQATLCELTATTVASAIREQCPETDEVLVCGGGVHNQTLMARLAVHLAPCLVQSTAVEDIDPDWVEAMAFAWLARRTMQGLPGNLPAVTGARKSVVLGGIYAA